MSVPEAQAVICDTAAPIAKQMRALFYLRNIHTDESVHAIAKAFASKSVLLKHEVAYVLGQMNLRCAVPYLIEVLRDEEEDEIVRHEAGEALGNFGGDHVFNILEVYVAHPIKPISQTCYIACKKIREGRNCKSKFDSYDPANPLDVTLEEAQRIFLDPKECLFRRYQAMFRLRDIGNSDAIRTLGNGMGDSSALLKHEISFIFGQMRDKRAMPYLISGMEKESEHGMVRHECAEALGILGDEKAKKALMRFENDPCDILRESVEVAMDIHKYITSEELEYCTV